jgi:hypothetical protein
MERTVLHIKGVFYFYLQVLLQTYFDAINIQRVTLETCARTRVGGLQVKWWLLQCD